MRSFIFAILFVTFILSSFGTVIAKDSNTASDNVKVLFVGNSYTSWAQEVLEFFITNTKPQAEFEFHTVGGSHLSLFANEEIEYGQDFLDSLNSQTWDYVVLQDRSVAVGRGDDWDDAFKKSVNKLSKLIRESGAEPILYMTWARDCLLYTSPSPRDRTRSRMPSSA